MSEAVASWNGAIIAKCPLASTQKVEGNIYFPPSALVPENFTPTTTHTTCGWKGVASYYSVVVNGQSNKDAAWYYPDPLQAAQNIKGHIAFWKGVKVEVV